MVGNMEFFSLPLSPSQQQWLDGGWMFLDLALDGGSMFGNCSDFLQVEFFPMLDEAYTGRAAIPVIQTNLKFSCWKDILGWQWYTQVDSMCLVHSVHDTLTGQVSFCSCPSYLLIWGEPEWAPNTYSKFAVPMYVCIYVCMYVCMYVVIRRPRAHSACAICLHITSSLSTT